MATVPPNYYCKLSSVEFQAMLVPSSPPILKTPQEVIGYNILVWGAVGAGQKLRIMAQVSSGYFPVDWPPDLTR